MALVHISTRHDCGPSEWDTTGHPLTLHLCNTCSWSHTSLEELRAAQHHFAVARDWEKFHTPRNLIMALVRFGI